MIGGRDIIIPSGSIDILSLVIEMTILIWPDAVVIDGQGDLVDIDALLCGETRPAELLVFKNPRAQAVWEAEDDTMIHVLIGEEHTTLVTSENGEDTRIAEAVRQGEQEQ